MLGDTVLELFPTRGLDQSILVAVLLGIYVLLFLTEVFGWVWAGLVVPGYLASVFVISPAAGIAISIEAIVTFVICRVISDVLGRTGAWSPLFGRDRFFVLVVVSVLIRQGCEIWLLPLAVGWFDLRFGLELADVHDVASIGLVLVPLVANMFWKLTLPRGVFQIGVSVGLVYVLLAFVLLPHTNLSFSNLELTYENVALDFLGSAKAYIILLIGTFVAARFNLTFGWDYNGILVPSLLALSWFSPLSLMASIVEALVLLLLTRALLAAPLVKTMNFEGPRKIAVVFTVGFLIKYLAGWALGDRWPGLKLTELFGFGYVLTSLLAVKMLNTKRVGRVLLPTLQVSLIAFVAGSLVGFALELAWPTPGAVVARPRGTPTTTSRGLDAIGVMTLATARARLEAAPEASGTLRTAELRAYAALWRAVGRAASGAGDAAERRGEVDAAAARVGMRYAPIADGFVLLEAEERLTFQRGFEVAAVFPGRPGPILIVPRPAREQPAAEAAAVLCQRVGCRALIAAGSDDDDGGRTTADPLAHPRSTFQVALRQLGDAPVIALRASAEVALGTPRLHQRGQLTSTTTLRALWPGTLELRWDPPPGIDLSWAADPAYSVLRAHPDDLWALLADAGAPPPTRPGRIEAALAEWLAGDAPIPSEPSEGELRVLEELAARMLAGRPERLPWLARVAGTLAHQVIVLPDGGGAGHPLWLLSAASGGGWLSLVVDPRARAPLAFEVPRPRLEPGSSRIAAEAFGRTGATALLVDRELAARAPDLYDDPGAVGNFATPFEAVHEAIHGALRGRPGAAVLSVRGLGLRRGVDADLVIGLGVGAFEASATPPALAALLGEDGPLGRIAPAQRIADAGLLFHGLTGAGTPQLAHSRAIGGAASAALWFGEGVRRRYADDDRSDHAERFAAVGLAVDPRSLATILGAPLAAASAPSAARAADLAAATELAERYRATLDLAVLDALVHRVRLGRGRVALAVGHADDLGLAHLVVEDAALGRRVGFLLGRPPRACPPVAAGDADAIRDAIFLRCSAIAIEAGGSR